MGSQIFYFLRATSKFLAPEGEGPTDSSSHHWHSTGQGHLAPRICVPPFLNYYKEQNISNLKDENKVLQLHWEPEKLLQDKNIPSRDPNGSPNEKKDLEQGYTNPGCQIAQATKFCTAVTKVCQSSAQRFFHVIFPGPRILRCSSGFWKISANLLYNITAKPPCSVFFT